MCEILANDPSLNFERDMSVRYNEIKEEIHESKEWNNRHNYRMIATDLVQCRTYGVENCKYMS